ncbi:PREDICTED: codanin-1 [Nicrophorus vespilloides]|uniref:Codanin-1 n=1 Tax=Nicrophorus vespilloides TaxID=110193 RepID=A0ABM1NIV8_NICVS|nr:PREDICTED: codanin-1 [Nicrophorus vespilloides]
MAKVLLNNVINGETDLQLLFSWLKNNLLEKDETSNCPDFDCSIGEFISFFLNTIHENAQNINNAVETPKKIYTPKAIRKLETPESQKPKRRSALFSEQHDDRNDLSPKCSTPRNRNKSLLNDSTFTNENTCMSPVSPIYMRLNCNITPKSQKKITLTDRSLCLGDFITKRGSSSKKKGSKNENTEPQEGRRHRRINPTNLKFNNSFGKTENSFNFSEESFPEIAAENAEDQRSVLAVERMKIVIDEPKVILTKKIAKKEVLPDLNLATCRKQLDVLVEMYVYCLNNNLVLNLTSELYFVLSLILNKQFESEIPQLRDGDCDYVSYNDLFSCIHNTIYFAIKVLERQVNILGMLDKQTVKLLINNDRLKCISPEMNKALVDINEGKIEISLPLAEATQNVCFITETDNRQNFPSEVSFHAFRKQRDLFYELLRIWETHHLSEGWNFGMALGGKIKSLFSLHSDEANFRHFSRLFKSQLIGACSKINIENIPEDQLSFLSTIPNIDSEKLNRLTNRLVKKASPINGINSPPAFLDCEEFYRDFILTASLHNFNIHLKDTMTNEVITLSNSNFPCNGLQETESQVDLEIKTSYVSCLRSLRTLAKFLGFLETLPYSTASGAKEDKVISTDIEMRNWYRPHFHLEQILADSVSSGNLILTIPWITKYISMLPAATLRLNYFVKLFDTLFEIFYNADPSNPSGLLVRLCLGWLFELNHFPSEFYYVWCTRNEKNLLQKVQAGLDSTDVVCNDALYICCPYLCEFKRLLQNTSTGKSTITVKHITPVTAMESPAQVSQKKIKLQLEEAFLNTQPVSMRKTVEFVSERVASACVKTVCNVIIPKYKEIAMEELKELLINTRPENGQFESKEFLAETKVKCDVLLQSKLKDLLFTCNEEINKQIEAKVKNSVCLLLADEELKQTKSVSSSIAIRMCRNRVQQWVIAHLNAGVFSKDFDAYLTKFVKREGALEECHRNKCSELLSAGNNLVHNEEVPSAVKIVEILRNLCIDVLEGSPVNTEDVTLMIDQCNQCLDQREDVNISIVSMINKMLLDFFIILIAKLPDLCTNTVMQLYIDFWKSKNSNEDLFKNLICPRNVSMLGGRTKSWEKLVSFIVTLLKTKLLCSSDFETQYLAIYKQNWNDVSLKCLSSSVRDIAAECSKLPECNAKFTYLLNFVSDFCSDLESF